MTTVMSWTLQDQLDWEVLREADGAVYTEVAARRPDLVAQREAMARQIREYLERKPERHGAAR